MVDINKVYERVLFLANKEQRGYITPDEFNSFADQAQLEVFESYFLKKFQTDQAPETTDDYSDIAANVEEKITFFDNTIYISQTNLGGTATTPPDYPGFRYPDNFYRLGLVSVNGRMADEVSHKELTYVNLSPLTAPTATQPVFVRHEGGFRVFPLSVQQAELVYVRKPAQPVWGYDDGLVDPNTGDLLYNPGTSVDFELHPSDEQELVYKILALAGVTIKQPDVAQFAQAKDQQIAQTEG